MSTPRHIHIFPKCGLEIELDRSTFQGLDYSDSSTPWKYMVTNGDQIRQEFCSTDCHQEAFEGWLSPTSPVTLPPRIKEKAGIPNDATSYAFMYPPQGLAEILLQQSCQDNLDLHPKSKATLDLKGIESAAILGGFAYFDAKWKCICINAFSTQRSERKLKFSGPHEVNKSACYELYKFRRAHPLQLDIFHEVGFMSYAWVRPKEVFQFKSVFATEGPTNKNGTMIFFRENGTGVAYAVDQSEFVDPTGYVGILSEAVQKIGDARFTKQVILPIDEVNAWGARVKHWTPQMAITKLVDTLKDERKVIHMACHAVLGHKFISDVLSNVEEKHYLSYQDSFGWNPLHYACCFSPRDITLIDMLVSKCPEAVVQLDIHNRSPLHIACNSDTSDEVIAVLLEADAKKVTISKQTRGLGLLPIHLACFNGAQDGIIHALLDADKDGTTVIQKSRGGQLPLHLALLKKLPTSIVRAFLEADSRLSKRGRQNFDSITNNYDDDIHQFFDGKLPLHLACYNNSSTEIIQLLLDKDTHNATINEVVNTVPFSEDLGDGQLFGVDDPSSMVCLYKKVKAKSTQRDASQMSTLTLPSNEEESNDGVVALHLAMRHGSKDVISLLLHKEMEKTKDKFEVSMLHKIDVLERTPLHIACQCNVGYQIIQHLLKLDPFKKTTQMRDVQGFMPIHYACENKDTCAETINILLDAEEKYLENCFNEDGVTLRKSTHTGDTERRRTPLYLAVKSGVNPKVYERLLQPENFLLKDFDEPAMADLADVVKDNKVIQAKVIGRLSERVYFCLLIIELYACIGALTTFMIGSYNLVSGSISLTEPICLLAFTSVFIGRELLQIMSVGADYIGDIWSWVEIVNIVLLLVSSSTMIQEADTEILETSTRRILSVTGFFVTLQFIFYLRSTFLPFARFVGGLLMILTTLIPFLVVSALLVWAFIFAFWMTRQVNKNEIDCRSIGDCIFKIIADIFDYEPEGFHVLDALFAFIIIIVLLNVVIAIVGEAWESAEAESNRLFWKYRLEKIFELRKALKMKQHLSTRRFGFQNSFHELLGKIDNMRDLSYTSDVSWTKAPYNVLTEKDHYENPRKYFSPDQVKLIYDAHSLQADMYWAETDKDHLMLCGKTIILLKWVCACMLYVLLIVLGIPTFGVLWPMKFRAGLLTLGFTNEEMESTTDDASTKKNQ